MRARVWAEAQSMIVDMLRVRIERNPQVLLEVDGGPRYLKASMVFAQMIDHEGRVTIERISEIRDVLFSPVFAGRESYATSDDDKATEFPHIPALDLKVTEWRLQSIFAVMSFSPEVIEPPAGVELDNDFRYTVALVRYRRHLPQEHVSFMEESFPLCSVFGTHRTPNTRCPSH